MRIKSKGRGYFNGTHKGCVIEIERETDPDVSGAFYILVLAPDGGALYDGWSPPDVLTMAEAKREALYGACLRPRPPAENSLSGRQGSGANTSEGQALGDAVNLPHKSKSPDHG